MNSKQKHLLVWICLLLAAGTAVGALLSAQLDTSPVHTPGLRPDSLHLLGTDHSGRDLFSLLTRSSGISLGISLTAAFCATLIGALLGCVAGYLRSFADDVIMRVTDIFLLIPSLPLVIVLAAYLGPGMFQISLLITLTAWPATARVIRAQVLKLREAAFVKNARNMGAGKLYIILHHILPNCGELLLAKIALNIAGALLTESGISFLGLGDPAHMSWGSMLKDAFEGAALLNGCWWWYLPPMLCISVTVMLFNLAGESLMNRTPSATASRVPMDTAPDTSAASHPHGSQSTSAPPLLSVRGLTIAFPNSSGEASQPVVNGLDLEIRQGQKYTLVGATGAGKSLLLLAILGLLPREAHALGQVRVNGQDISTFSNQDLLRYRGTAAGYVPQGIGCALNPVLPIGIQIAERIRIHFRLDCREAMTRALRSLLAVGLPDPDKRIYDYPHHLSGGMKQRALMAMALVSDPPLLLADEPTKGLDPAAFEDVMAMFRGLRDQAVLAVSHDLKFAESLGGNVLVMVSGTVVEAADADSFFTEPLHPYSRAIISAQPSRGMIADQIVVSANHYGENRGCVYRHSCPVADMKCQEAPPVFQQGGHWVRCWHHAA